MNLFDLTGKVALVTGGAHSIGFAIGVGLAQAGATVCFNCSNEESRDRGIKAYRDAGVEVHGYVCAGTEETAAKALEGKDAVEFGGANIQCNGISKTPAVRTGIFGDDFEIAACIMEKFAIK